MRRLFLLILFVNLFSCNHEQQKSIEGLKDVKEKKHIKKEHSKAEHTQTVALIENFLVSMNSAKSIDDSRESFYKYYYEPKDIIEGELINYYVDDFQMIWKDVQNAKPPFTETVYTTLYGESLLNSAYALLLLKNTTCDDCVVLLPKHREGVHYDICVKNNKIYSTIGTYDMDKEEYIWYRDKKHPPLQFGSSSPEKIK